MGLLNKNKSKNKLATKNLKKEAVNGGSACDNTLAAIKVPPKNMATKESFRYNKNLLTILGIYINKRKIILRIFYLFFTANTPYSVLYS